MSGFGWSLVGHGVLLLLILFGGIVLPHRHEPTNLGIKATLVEQKAPTRKSRPDPAADARAAEQARVEVQKAERLEQQRQAEEKKVEAEARAAEATRKAEAKKLAAEKQRAEQQKAESQRKQAAEAKAKAEAEKQAREKQAAEKRLAEQKRADIERKAAEAKVAAAKRAEDERRKAAQAEIDQALEEEERLLAAADSGALSAYVGLIRQRVTRNWARPASARAGLACEVMVTQIPGGQVTGVEIGSCNGDEAVRRSIEAAVLRASPLPMPDDPALFERNLRFTFKPEQ